MKKNGSILLALVLLTALPLSAFAGDISLVVNGDYVQFTDAKPFIDENARTLVPLRAAADAMGLEVKWDAESREAAFYGIIDIDTDPIQQNVIFTLDDPNCYLYSCKVDPVSFDVEECPSHSFNLEMDTCPIIRDGRIYAPIRYLADAFGYSIEWQGDVQTILLNN